MATTCMHPTPSVASHAGRALQLPTWSALHTLARLGQWATQWVQARHSSWRQTGALRTMNAHQLQDVGAPHWLHLRAQSHNTRDNYEHAKAMSRLQF